MEPIEEYLSKVDTAKAELARVKVLVDQLLKVAERVKDGGWKGLDWPGQPAISTPAATSAVPSDEPFPQWPSTKELTDRVLAYLQAIKAAETALDKLPAQRQRQVEKLPY